VLSVARSAIIAVTSAVLNMCSILACDVPCSKTPAVVFSDHCRAPTEEDRGIERPEPKLPGGHVGPSD